MARTLRYNYGINKSVEDFIKRAGAGNAGAHVIATNAAPYDAGDDELCYAIHCYTDDCAFAELQEAGEDVDAIRLDAGGVGYPLDAVIPGHFTRVQPAGGHVVALFIANPITP